MSVCRFCELPAPGWFLVGPDRWWLCRVHLPLSDAGAVLYPPVMHPDGTCPGRRQCRTASAEWQTATGPRMRGGFVIIGGIEISVTEEEAA